MPKADGKQGQNGFALSKAGCRGLHIRCGSQLLLLPGEGNRGVVPLGCCATGELLWAARVGNSSL